MLSTVAVQNYRSLHDLRVPLGRLTVVTGANGSGKSNVYRALRLLSACAERQVIASLSPRGGLPSALWAGPEVLSGAVRRGEHPVLGTTRARPVNLQLGFASDDFSYLIDLGVPPSTGSAFDLDPEIKRELVWAGETRRPATILVKRDGPLVQIRSDDPGGGWRPLTADLLRYESVLTEVSDLRRAPELLAVRDSRPCAPSSASPPTTRPPTSHRVLPRVRAAVPDATILVIDDGSPDGTADLAEAVGGELGQIEVMRRTEKQGWARLPGRVRAGASPTASTSSSRWTPTSRTTRDAARAARAAVDGRRRSPSGRARARAGRRRLAPRGACCSHAAATSTPEPGSGSRCAT